MMVSLYFPEKIRIFIEISYENSEKGKVNNQVINEKLKLALLIFFSWWLRTIP
jgi:hypothetical protein